MSTSRPRSSSKPQDRQPGPGGPRTLAPLLRDRWGVLWHGPGFGRAVLLRRVAAALLLGLAAVLALMPPAGTATTPVVVANDDLAPGTVLGATQVRVVALPPEAIPDGAARDTAQVLDRTLAAPVRRGEPVTDVRLAGPPLVRAISPDPAAVSVPLRLPDPGIAKLLRPGSVVDVVTQDQRHGEAVLLARAARVLAVMDPDVVADEPLILIALEPPAATRVAAASLSHPLTVTVP